MISVELMSTLTPEDVHAYSDRLYEGPGRSFWGYILQCREILFKMEIFVLYDGEAYDAEVFGATIPF